MINTGCFILDGLSMDNAQQYNRRFILLFYFAFFVRVALIIDLFRSVFDIYVSADIDWWIKCVKFARMFPSFAIKCRIICVDEKHIVLLICLRSMRNQKVDFPIVNISNLRVCVFNFLRTFILTQLNMHSHEPLQMTFIWWHFNDNKVTIYSQRVYHLMTSISQKWTNTLTISSWLN